MIRDNEVVLRPIVEADLKGIWEMTFKQAAPEWKKWDAPYFPHTSMSYEAFLDRTAGSYVNEDSRWAIEVEGTLSGLISYYWEDEAFHWLEMGIVLFEPERWGKGVGTRALRLWTAHLFQSMPLARVGLTTWSGNERMIRVAEKLGMQMEARIRKVRYYQGQHYDSIRMGILREEWQQLQKGREG